MTQLITTSTVCQRLGLTEPSLRYFLRQPDAPRPALHPTARLFLWCESDVKALAEYLSHRAQSGKKHEPAAPPPEGSAS